MMAFRISSVVAALVMAASAAAQATIPICHITSDVDPKTFETLYVTGEEYAAYAAAGDLSGPCTEWLGELCDDNLKCTVDYDYDTASCLPEPRVTSSPTCTETTEDI
eukprot:g7681.t1